MANSDPVPDARTASSRFCRPEKDGYVPHDYGPIFCEQPCGPSARLVIAASRNATDLLVSLSSQLIGDPYYLLYVLLIPRRGNREPGRYQSDPFSTHAELAAALGSFRAYFESDGRHHVWVGSAANDGVLVYDHHDVIFAYGPLADFRQILTDRGYREQSFWFPAPHSHAYQPHNDDEEERLMSELAWTRFPLQPGDDWQD